MAPSMTLVYSNSSNLNFRICKVEIYSSEISEDFDFELLWDF